jgi:hypothetical protein
MKHSSTVILVITISLMTIVAAAPRVAHADASSPSSTLTVGDWWKYNVQTPVAGLILTGTQTDMIVFQANTTGTLWTERQTASGTLAGLGATGTWVGAAWGHFRETDLAEVDSRLTLNMTLVGRAGTATVYFAFYSQNTPPVRSYQFPLSVGSSWSMSGGTETVVTSYYYSFDSTIHSSQNMTSTDAVYNVIASPLTDVPAGIFDSYQIRQRDPDGTYTDSYYSPQAENVVKKLGFASNGTQESSMSLTDYSAWPYKTAIGLSVNGINYNAAIETDVSAYNVTHDFLSITFLVTGRDGATGKASVWIPVKANTTDLKILLDSKPISFNTNDNQTHYQLLFSYPLSTHTLTITYGAIPQKSPFLQRYMVPLILGAIGVAASIIAIVTFLVVRRRNASELQPVPFWQPPGTPGPGTSPPPTSILPNIALAGVVIIQEIFVLTAPISLALSVWMGWIAAWSCQTTLCATQTSWALSVFPYFLAYGVGAIVSAALIERGMLRK